MLGVGSPVERQRFAVEQVERSDLEANRLEIGYICRILDRVVAEMFRSARFIIAFIAVDAERAVVTAGFL